MTMTLGEAMTKTLLRERIDRLERERDEARRELDELALRIGYGERPEGQGHVIRASGPEMAEAFKRAFRERDEEIDARQVAEAERDAALEQVAAAKKAIGSDASLVDIYIKVEEERDAAMVERDESERMGRIVINERDDARYQRDAALAQVEALRTIRSLCRGCLKPMKEHPPGPPCPPFLPGPLRAAGSALFRLVDAALSSAPAPAVHTREPPCTDKGCSLAHSSHSHSAMDAQPDSEEKP